MSLAQRHSSALLQTRIATSTLAIAMWVALATPRVAHAQGESHLVSVGFGGGMTVPVGNVKDSLDTGVNGQAFVLVHLGPLPALRFNLGYQKFDYKQALGFSGQHTKIVSGTGGLSVDLIGGPIRPYITAGLGAFDVESAVAGTTGTQSTSNVNFGIDGGAGIKVNIGRLDGFVEGRVQNVYTRNTGVIARSDIRSVPVTFGLLFGL